MVSSAIVETNTSTFSIIHGSMGYSELFLLSSIKTGFTSKLAARIDDEEGTLDDKGPS